MKNLLVVIPAIKKNAVIPDQLIKKLNGITLIQRAINTALMLTTSNHIFVITDSEEISLICERNSITYYRKKELLINSDNILDIVSTLTKEYKEENILLFRANTPLVDGDLLKEAYDIFLKNNSYILTSVKHGNRKLLEIENTNIINTNLINYFEELKAFHIFSRKNIEKKVFKPFIIETEKSIEIETYQDWWVCEKVLKRKRIVFNVIGSMEIGMGHIYHSLALAHEISDHEIIFVCDEKYKIAVDKIAAMDYKVITTKNTLTTILNLKPNLVINDILNTEEFYVRELINNNIKVVNFEDLGKGSKYANIVFNELYDTPQCSGTNYLWGYEYLALRDEFYEASPHLFLNKIKEVLITFGGTDQNNLTLLTLKSILKICEKNNILINIVCGNGYIFKKELEKYLSTVVFKKIKLLYECNSISKIMEKTQVSISSNGRTVYELAHMNIPSIIVSHHKRELTHTFSSLEKGFLNVGLINNDTASSIQKAFLKLVDDNDYRELLFMNIKRFSFQKNKQKVVNKIMELM